MNKLSKKYIIISILITIFLVIVGVGIAYAYFGVGTDGTTTNTMVETTTFDIETSLTNLSGINVDDLSLIEESEIQTKAASINFDVKSKSEGKSAGKFSVYLKDIVISSGMIDSSFKWQLVMDNNIIASGDFSNLTTKGTKDSTKTDTQSTKYYSNYILASNISFNGFNKSNLILRVYLLNDSTKDQSNLLSGTFECKVGVEAYNAVYKCIRAKTLHNDGTNTYGNLGKKGTLASGDAFNCDINGDGKYNETNERFYYITDLASNSNYAVLLYYNNTVGGVANNTGAIAYNSANVNNLGPVTALSYLPTTLQWKNVSLSNTTRDITDEAGTATKSEYSYEGYAARFLTYQEVVAACSNASDTEGSLDNCTYLIENTKYQNSNYIQGYWLETTSNSYENHARIIRGPNRFIGYSNAGNSNYFGVRPAIEVLKSDISY